MGSVGLEGEVEAVAELDELVAVGAGADHLGAGRGGEALDLDPGAAVAAREDAAPAAVVAAEEQRVGAVAQRARAPAGVRRPLRLEHPG